MKKDNIYITVIIFLHFILLFLTGFFRHWGYLTSINDMANFDQAIWGTIQGNILLSTASFNIPISRLALHFDPIQLIFVPFYLINPTVTWLIAAQALSLSITAWPLFVLASRIFESTKLGLAWALIYLMNPFLLNSAAWDFHPITLAVPFVALSFLALELKNFKLLLFCSLTILLCKEHLGIMVVAFGFIWWLKTRKKLSGAFLMTLGAGHFYLVLQIIMPAFSPTGQHVMVSKGLGQLSRYTWLGDSIEAISASIISKPYYFLKTIFFSMGGLVYLLILLLPFLFFPLLSMTSLLPAIADLTANMLSANPMPRSPIAYHSATLIPIFTVAAIYGTKKISKFQKRFSAAKSIMMIMLCTALIGYLLSPFPLPGAYNIWAPVSFINLPDRRVQEIRTNMDKEKSLSVQANIGAHFSQRKEIYRYPNQLDQVDAVILHLASPTLNVHGLHNNQKSSKQSTIGTLDSHLQMDRYDYLDSVRKLLLDKNFGITYWDDPWLVLERGTHRTRNFHEVTAKLKELKEEW